MGKTNLGRVAFAPRGTYNNETSYKRLDVVEYEGSSYLFLKDTTGIAPTGDGEVTMLLAKKGKDFIYDDFTPEQLAALKGAKGDKGDPGKGLTILGYYSTLDLLKAAVTAPEPGDAYGIGTAVPYDIYVYDGVTNDWVNNGTMSGGGGTSSGANVVLIPGVVVNLTNTSTSAEILTVLGGKEAFIDAVTRVKNGALLALDVNGSPSPVQFSFGSFVQEQDVYQLAFVYVSAIDLSANFMITILLSGDVAAIEKSNHQFGYANIVSIPPDVMPLSNESTSEQIKTAFGGKPAFDAIIEKVRAGNAVGVISNLGASVSLNQMIVSNYNDADNVVLSIVTVAVGAFIQKNVKVENGVFSCVSSQNALLLDSSLVSDPTVGGTDKPASAEAVKMVNDKIGWYPDPDSTEEQVCTGEFFVDFDGVKKQVYYRKVRGQFRFEVYPTNLMLYFSVIPASFGKLILEASGMIKTGDAIPRYIYTNSVASIPTSQYDYPSFMTAFVSENGSAIRVLAGAESGLNFSAYHQYIFSVKYIK